MIGEVSRFKSPRRPPTAAPISTRLAPGFRFHPTDEELVSYYLKRKVTGQPIRVNPISEVDLYKAEPWDLPPHSRLHSRDLEWYFFTALDRKYSNRSRTNRATEEGYWKTTGKDRPIRRRSLTIGMKKTLVYHAGRAPRGQRTNWVMHEYRLEDEYSSHPGISQNQDKDIQHSDVVPVVAKSAEQDIGSNTEDSSSPMQKILKDEAYVDEFSGYVNFPSLQENTPILNGARENSSVEDQSSTKNNGYVQLNDIVGEENICFTSDGYLNECPLGEHDDISVIVDGNSENLLAKHDNEKLLDTTEFSTLPDQLQICSVQHDMQVDLYDTAQLAEDNLTYYDALGYDIQYLENSFPNESSLMPRDGYDFLEELMAYYDATNDTLHYARTDSFVSELSSSAEAAGSCTSSSGAVSVVENVAKPASLFKASNINSTLGGSTEKLSADIQQKDPEAKTLMNRLASMLESISAPPAFAAERTVITKMSGHISTASTSSFHVASHMIQIQNLTTDMGCLEGWTLWKHCVPSFRFFCAMGDKDISKSLLHEPLKCRFFPSFFRGGFLSFFVSVLMLALSYRMGVFVYNLSMDMYPGRDF